jgi:hypothetical protein
MAVSDPPPKTDKAPTTKNGEPTLRSVFWKFPWWYIPLILMILWIWQDMLRTRVRIS